MPRAAARAAARSDLVGGASERLPADEAAANLLDVIAKLTPAQTGGFYDYAGREIVW
ncbi:MAG: hypothetical protein NWP79_01915 [Paracoccaceae bacterium]|nr:hypothetical protein [Paracoccaceae bacterium]